MGLNTLHSSTATEPSQEHEATVVERSGWYSTSVAGFDALCGDSVLE